MTDVNKKNLADVDKKTIGQMGVAIWDVGWYQILL